MPFTVYFGQKPLYLISEITPEIEEFLHHEETVFIDDFNVHTVKAMIHEMEQSKILTGVFLHEDPAAVLSTLKKKLTFVPAAGGLVHNPHRQILMIFRKGKWDLPKGKLDGKEDPAACAVREIKEETGLKEVKIEKPLTTTWHTYHENGHHIIKETNWFLMKSPDQKEFHPQKEEDIDKCEWVSVDQLQPYTDHTYSTILQVINEGLPHLKKKSGH